MICQLIKENHYLQNNALNVYLMYEKRRKYYLNAIYIIFVLSNKKVICRKISNYYVNLI